METSTKKAHRARRSSRVDRRARRQSTTRSARDAGRESRLAAARTLGAHVQERGPILIGSDDAVRDDDEAALEILPVATRPSLGSAPRAPTRGGSGSWVGVGLGIRSCCQGDAEARS